MTRSWPLVLLFTHGLVLQVLRDDRTSRACPHHRRLLMSPGDPCPELSTHGGSRPWLLRLGGAATCDVAGRPATTRRGSPLATTSKSVYKDFPFASPSSAHHHRTSHTIVVEAIRLMLLSGIVLLRHPTAGQLELAIFKPLPRSVLAASEHCCFTHTSHRRAHSQCCISSTWLRVIPPKTLQCQVSRGDCHFNFCGSAAAAAMSS